MVPTGEGDEKALLVCAAVGCRRDADLCFQEVERVFGSWKLEVGSWALSKLSEPGV